MEKQNEVFFGVIFIMLLMIMILSFANVSASGSKSTVTITDSYNTYNIQNTPQPSYTYDSYGYNRYPTIKYNNYDRYPTVKYNNYDRKVYQNENYLRYNPKSKYSYTTGLFGNEINDYKVYFQNQERKQGYFTVKFYLRNYEGKTRVESVTHYLKPYEGKVFRYKNVFDDEYDYAWNYKIISHTKTSNQYSSQNREYPSNYIY